MSDFKELKAEYVRLAGKNPPPMSADALRAKIDELKAGVQQSAEGESGTGGEAGASSPPPVAETASGDASKSDAIPAEQLAASQQATPTPPPAAPAARAQQPDELAAELEELGLTMAADGSVGLIMTAGLSGPEVCLAPGDDHACPAREAIALVRAGFAVPAAQ